LINEERKRFGLLCCWAQTYNQQPATQAKLGVEGQQKKQNKPFLSSPKQRKE